ncbi:chorismate mutase [Tenggerimyces flavus]|uniref:Chorismate mutase n=1 Tax=Tenggerimyces flavus TaxID=1708749 RepID=A0ABV7Y3S5_9ACTN|nr:chorismate mutase [Tenggerimyces flavus]MBM7788567.1 chorismate mutase [Tenggerimyces flavus]
MDQLAEAVRPLLPATRPSTLAECRAAIDEIDTALAVLLEHRAALTEQVQRIKPVGGHAGRDLDREEEIVARMAELAPRLGADQLRRIVTAIIEASLDVAKH